MDKSKLTVATLAAVVLLLGTGPLVVPQCFPLNLPEIAQATRQETSLAAGPKRLLVILDGTGTLRDSVSQLYGPALISRMQTSTAGVTVVPSADVSMLVIKETVKSLQKQDIKDLHVAGFVTRDGRLFATWGLNGEYSATPPLLKLDGKRLSRIAKSSGLVNKLPLSQKPLLYLMFINEIGEIVGLEQLRGPQIPAVESELVHTSVIRSGSRGAEPVPIAFVVEVEVE